MKISPLRNAKLYLLAIVNRIFPNYAAWFSTIRGRLICAFGFAALLTIIGALAALYEFTAIGATTSEILSRSFPTTVISLRLAEGASSLVSSAPRLMAAPNDTVRNEIMNGIYRRAQGLEEGIVRLRKLGITSVDEIDLTRNSLIQRLGSLNRAVKDRSIIANERYQLALSIRSAHEALIDGLAPAIDDANFDLMTGIKKTGMDEALDSTLTSLRRFLEVQSESNLLAGLLTEASLVDDASRLEPLRDSIAAAKRKIELNLSTVADKALQKKLYGLYEKLGIIGADDGIITLRDSELHRQHDAQAAFLAVESDAADLKKTIDELVDKQTEIAHQFAQRAEQQIHTGEAVLVLLTLVSILGAGLIGWLYVGRNIADRLGILSNAMRRLADGDLNIKIEDDRQDEIAEMARALQIFRQATTDAAAANQKELKQAQLSESRRLLFDGATQCFELAVSNVAQTLDRAAVAMDGSARDMGTSASLNQRESLLAAAASESATSNVETVAAAAEEIAHSIEHIVAQVSESATIARQATGEAQTINSSIEKLSTAVAEISQISNLIHTIARQTNLLALNATIEAARAGNAGRGFAVVAQEVKALAAQTGQATEEITRKIHEIEQTTSRSVQAIKTITATILQLDGLADNVAAAVRQQDSVAQEISRSANAAAKGTREVSAAVREVSSSAVRTGQVATTVLSAAGALAEQSQLLRHEVEQYLAQVRVA